MQVEMNLFVYGSFADGHRHHSLISPYILSKKPAKVMAIAYRLAVGLPVLVVPPDEGAQRQWINGELLTLSAPDLVYKLLNEFHGLSPLNPEDGVYRRQTVKAVCEDQLIDAEIYLLNPQHLPKDAEFISDGDWLRDMQTRPSILSSLSERHAGYLKKLAATKGRQVIQYDLNLSRDLMKLGLIVDKGRRLALSRLGKDVISFLQ